MPKSTTTYNVIGPARIQLRKLKMSYTFTQCEVNACLIPPIPMKPQHVVVFLRYQL